jgi:hypothetical protein
MKIDSAPTWLNFYLAAYDIEHWLRVSGGMARRMLREACASGDVRSQKQPYYRGEGEGPPEVVKPSEWLKDQVDLAQDEDGCKYWVDVDEKDFRYWLDQLSTTSDEPSPRDAAIVKRLKAGNRPGKNIQWKVFDEVIRNDCNKPATERGFSDETIENVTRELLRVGRFG